MAKELDRGDTAANEATPYQLTLARAHQARLARMFPQREPAVPKPRPAPAAPPPEPPPVLVEPSAPTPRSPTLKLSKSMPICVAIQYAVAEEFGMPRYALLNRSRRKGPVEARQTAIYLCRVITAMTWSGIARQFGGRDHTTILHAYKRIRARSERDPHFAERVMRLQAEIENETRQ